MIRLLAFAITSVLALAQPPAPAMSQPSLGYVFDDNARAIRLISGVPGAASLDISIAAGATLDSAFVQSRAQIAIGNLKDGGLAVIRWAGAPQVVNLNSSLSRATQVAFSRAGNRVAISDGTTVELWSALDGTPAQQGSFNPDGGVTAMALNNDGLLALGTGSGSVMLVGDDSRILASGGNWIALAFLPNGTNLLAVDAAGLTLTLIQDVQNTAAASLLASLNENPGALAVAADGSQAAVGLADNVTVVNLSTAAATVIPCNCQAVRFDQLQGNLVARFIDAQTGTQYLLDADVAAPWVAALADLNLGAAQ